MACIRPSRACHFNKRTTHTLHISATVGGRAFLDTCRTAVTRSGLLHAVMRGSDSFSCAARTPLLLHPCAVVRRAVRTARFLTRRGILAKVGGPFFSLPTAFHRRPVDAEWVLRMQDSKCKVFPDEVGTSRTFPIVKSKLVVRTKVTREWSCCTLDCSTRKDAYARDTFAPPQ